MTRDEAWLFAVNYMVSPGGQEEKAIQRLLNKVSGNVTAALALMTKEPYYEGWAGPFRPQDDSIAVRLMTKGVVCGPGRPCVRGMGSAATHSIEVWMPETDFVHNSPDFLIAWREVFEYIKAGRKRAVQMAMF